MRIIPTRAQSSSTPPQNPIPQPPLPPHQPPRARIFRRPRPDYSPPRPYDSQPGPLVPHEVAIKPFEEEVYANKNGDALLYQSRPGALVYDERLQVVCKLGFGLMSTVWLCRDLKEHRFVAVKFTSSSHPQAANERAANKRLGELRESHKRGCPQLALPFDMFRETTPLGRFQGFMYEPFGMTASEMCQRYQLKRLPKHRVKMVVFDVLLALNFLHTEAGLVHCGE